MKNVFRLSGVILLILSIFLVHSCKKKEEVPVITTTTITIITETSAKSGGTIISEGSGTIIGKGVCWSTGISPTIKDNITQDGAGAASFSSNIAGLDGGTTYYVRAYATNSEGTGYGMAMSFKTQGQPKVYKAPEPVTKDASAIKSTSAQLNATVNPNNLSTVVTFEYGTSISYGSSISFSGNPISGDAPSVLYITINSLTRGTTYHFRVKAVNSKGTVYGQDKVFTANYGFGELVAGGYIFYLDASKEHGMVAAPVDQGTTIKWYNGSFIETKATGMAFGTGQSNTTKIVNAQGGGNYAAKICDDLVLNNYSDWFLPSNGELSLMYTNLNLMSIGNFRNEGYWSSSEGYPFAYAWLLKFGYGDLYTLGKDASECVRAVRSF